ncbi:hypothetical protein AA0614_1077 [Komagataeibacter saccharivorans NRIC 0614]|nr:hypothetical protein AA0614_1077 [Komagataeibacter saccharivorans NRIC 0614]
MVIFPIELHKVGFKVRADFLKDGLHILQDCSGEDAAAVFGYKDQMGMKRKNTMSSAPVIIVGTHRPMVF